jgi:hypothetical protein
MNSLYKFIFYKNIENKIYKLITYNIMTLSLYFKVIFTTYTSYYNINEDWTPSELYTNVAPLILNDFGISNFELADTLPPFHGKSEEKPKIEPSTDIKLKDLYGDKINFIAIYIRPI